MEDDGPTLIPRPNKSPQFFGGPLVQVLMSSSAGVLVPKVRRKTASSSKGGVETLFEHVQGLLLHLFVPRLSPSKWEAPVILLGCLPYLVSDLQANFLWV